MSKRKGVSCLSCYKLKFDAKNSPWCPNCKKFLCAKCTKSIAKDPVACPNCSKKFHPGCCETYLTFLNANKCCIAYFSKAVASIVSVSCTTINNSDTSTNYVIHSALSQTMAPKPPPSQARTSLGDTSSTKLDTILSKLTKIESTMKDQAKSNDEIMAKLEQQEELNKEILSKLDTITHINDKIGEHDEQILDLKLNLQHLSQAFSTHASDSHSQSQPLAAELILAGIPSTITNTEHEIATMILTALGIPELATDILDIRILPKKNSSRVPHTITSDSQTATETISFVLKLKSFQVRDHIIDKKRVKPKLTVSEVFSINEPGLIYVNELLSTDTYKLRKATKAKATLAGFKYVWVKSGKIFARKNNGDPTIKINSEADLSKIE